MNSDEDWSVDDSVIQIVVFVFLALVVAGLVEALPEKVLSKFPQSVLVLLLFLIGGVVGIAVDNADTPEESRLGRLIKGLESAPEGIQLLFLPPLIFSELFKTNVHVFLQYLIPSLLLAFPGVLIGMTLTALFPVYILPSSWSWYEALAFGGMLSATDPVAVIALLHELGASKRLSSVISGESVLNDGSAIVVVTLFLDLQAKISYDAAGIVAFIFQEVLGSFALGIAFGLVLLLIFPLLKKQPTPLVALTFAVPYLCFAAALVGNMSGVLALVPLGLMANAFGRATIVGFVAERMEHFWNQAEFIANSILFAISGLFIADDLMSGNIVGVDWGYLFLLYILVILIRLVTVGMLYPFLKCTGENLSASDAVVIWWGGLRGAVSLTLSFVIRSSANVNEQVGFLTTFFMGGVVALTLIINAPSAGPLVRKLHLQHEPDENIHKELTQQFKEIATRSLLFAGAKQEEIKKALEQVSLSTNSEAEGCDDSRSSSPDRETHGSKLFQLSSAASKTLQEKRRHFLLAQSVTYNRLLDRRLISRTAWFILLHSIDYELDKRYSALDQWNTVLKSPVSRTLLAMISKHDGVLASYLGKQNIGKGYSDVPVEGDPLPLHHSRRSAASSNTKQTSKKLCRCDCYDLACRCCWSGSESFALLVFAEIAYAYLRAHQISRASLSTFQSDQDVLKHHRLQLYKESLHACEAPAAFLNAVRQHRPSILKRIKAHQLAASIRFQLYDKAFEIEDLGLLEENEIPAILEIVEKIGKAIEELEFDLHAVQPFDKAGNFEANEDLFPFIGLKSTSDNQGREGLRKQSSESEQRSQANISEIEGGHVSLEEEGENVTFSKQTSEIITYDTALDQNIEMTDLTSASARTQRRASSADVAPLGGQETAQEADLLNELDRDISSAQAVRQIESSTSARHLEERTMEASRKHWYG